MNHHARGSRARRAALAVAAGLVAFTGAGVQAASATPLRPAGAAVTRTAAGGGQSGVLGGALFGGNFPLMTEEPSFGRKLAIVRLYYNLGDSFPGPWKYTRLMVGHRTLLISLDSQGPSYAAIAAGREDATIGKFLEGVNAAAVKYHLGAIYVSFQHEPDSQHHRALGAPAQFVQAWDHIHQLAAARHLDWNDGGRLHWVLILIHSSWGNGRAATFWPGPNEVDLLAADGYNSYGCGSGGQQQPEPPSFLFNPLISFATAHGGMPVFLAEWGSDNVPAGTQATFIGQMQSYVAGHGDVAGAMYWNTHVGDCNYRVNGISASISALTTMGRSAALGGHVAGGAG